MAGGGELNADSAGVRQAAEKPETSGEIGEKGPSGAKWMG